MQGAGGGGGDWFDKGICHSVHISRVGSVKPRVMTSQSSVNSPKPHLKTAQNSEKRYKKQVVRAVLALPVDQHDPEALELHGLIGTEIDHRVGRNQLNTIEDDRDAIRCNDAHGRGQDSNNQRAVRN